MNRTHVIKKTFLKMLFIIESTITFIANIDSIVFTKSHRKQFIYMYM